MGDKVLAPKALDRPEAHGWPTGSFEDCLRVGRIVLGAAHEGSDEGGVDQTHSPTSSLEETTPMMSAPAGFHRDDPWIEAVDGGDQLCAADLARDDNAVILDAEHVERVLADVDRKRVQGHGQSPSRRPAQITGSREASSHKVRPHKA